MATLAHTNSGARRRITAPFMAFVAWFETQRRYQRAGRETVRLLQLSDSRLADLGLDRAEVGRAVFARHGLSLEPGDFAPRR